MTELDDRLGEVVQEYYPLQILSPDNELLKYFTLDTNEFESNQNREIRLEFLERFRGDFPTLNDLEEERVEMSFLEYGCGLVSNLLQNYCNSLKKELEIKIAGLRN
jgi:hypothetical protein